MNERKRTSPPTQVSRERFRPREKDLAAPGRAVAKGGEEPRPLWLFVTEPGLTGLLVKELKFRDYVLPKARPLNLFLRNYDLVVLPASQIKSTRLEPRLALQVLRCPVFGRNRLGDSQVDLLARQWRKSKCDGLIAMVAGNVFDRRDLTRVVTRKLAERGIKVADEPADPVWLIAVDDKFYFGFPHYSHQDDASRAKSSDREGSLPKVFASAILFAAKPKPGEVVWDPVVGTGTLLAEAAHEIADGTFIGTDIDEQVLKTARDNCRGYKNLTLLGGDSTKFQLSRRDISLVIANLPFGKQFSSAYGNEGLYEGILRNALKHAASTWRASVFTSDVAALVSAVAKIDGLLVERVAETRVRGERAAILLVTRLT
jgi:predicted RNA methylase